MIALLTFIVSENKVAGRFLDCPFRPERGVEALRESHRLTTINYSLVVLFPNRSTLLLSHSAGPWCSNHLRFVANPKSYKVLLKHSRARSRLIQDESPLNALATMAWEGCRRPASAPWLLFHILLLSSHLFATSTSVIRFALLHHVY